MKYRVLRAMHFEIGRQSKRPMAANRGLCILMSCVAAAMCAQGGVNCGARSDPSPEPPDWFAGDAHVHRGIGCGRANERQMLTAQELLEMMKTNNLAVISVLSDIGNGEIKFAEKDIPFITGRDHAASTPERIIHWDAEWHYDAEGVTFERKVIGGHLILLGLKQGGHPFAQYTYPILQWAKKQGAIGGYAHMQYLPFSFYPPPDGIPQSLDCCAPLEYPVEIALGSSPFLMEDVHGGDSAVQAYYRILNCGFRPGLVAGTDYSCNYLEPLGTLLTYVRIPDGKLSYVKWVEGITMGRTVVARNGHTEFLDLLVNDRARPGDQIHLAGKGPVRARIEWRSRAAAEGRIELVHDGAVVASQTASVAPGAAAVFETTADFAHSGWLAARRMDWQNGHQTHTGAVFVIVDSKPIRVSSSDAEFFVKWIDSLLEKTSPAGAWSKFLSHDRESAQKRYGDARAIFERIVVEAKAQGN